MEVSSSHMVNALLLCAVPRPVTERQAMKLMFDGSKRWNGTFCKILLFGGLDQIYLSSNTSMLQWKTAKETASVKGTKLVLER